jgi:hypothetical protein
MRGAGQVDYRSGRRGRTVTIEFQYTFEDLKEANAAHKPKAAEKHRASGGRRLGTFVFFVMFVGTYALLVASSPEASAGSGRPVLLDLLMPVLALAAFLGPWMLARAMMAHGAKGLVTTRGLIGWVVAVVLLAVFLWIRRHAPDPADGVVAAERSTWQSISDFVRPHFTWLVLTGATCIFLIRYTSRQLLTIWEGAPVLRRPFTLTVSDHGITIAEPLSRDELKWFAFDRVIETQNLFLLYVAEHLFHMVPKRAFADTAQIDEFRATIDNRITRRPTAFPVLPVGG